MRKENMRWHRRLADSAKDKGSLYKGHLLGSLSRHEYEIRPVAAIPRIEDEVGQRNEEVGIEEQGRHQELQDETSLRYSSNLGDAPLRVHLPNKTGNLDRPAFYKKLSEFKREPQSRSEGQSHQKMPHLMDEEGHYEVEKDHHAIASISLLVAAESTAFWSNHFFCNCWA